MLAITKNIIDNIKNTITDSSLIKWYDITNDNIPSRPHRMPM